ncbi:MAG TPA: class I SAM-dependent methyltransferase [Gammaproteobacteria bacterium]|nr:class I SAM-dependent methyltransferase [Gammaproteobacteria bacterium]
MAKRARFDKKYYERFYGGARERAAYRREEQRLGDFVCAYLKYLEQPVRHVVDIGCGLGQWREIVAKHFPRASYTGVEHSAYLCDELGWTRSSAVDFTARTPFDLVICKDTLQYLSPKDFRQAVANLAKLCRGALYASVLTTEDWDAVCDRRRTDDRVYLRTGSWYRRLFERHFVNVGGGVFLSERSPALPWELEKIGARAR